MWIKINNFFPERLIENNVKISMSNVDKTVKNLFDTELTKSGLSTFYVEKTLKTLKNF